MDSCAQWQEVCSRAVSGKMAVDLGPCSEWLKGAAILHQIGRETCVTVPARQSDFDDSGYAVGPESMSPPGADAEAATTPPPEGAITFDPSFAGARATRYPLDTTNSSTREKA